jgi:glutathione S-transferase
MYTLYSRPGSGGFVVEAALLLAGAPFKSVNVVKGSPPPDYFGISPLNQVPALTLPEGETITESAAICLLLTERFPEADLGPQPGAKERPKFLRWMLFMSSMLYPALMRYFYAGRSTVDPAGVEAVKQAAIAEADRGFEIIDEALAGRQWLVGGRRSIADIYLMMLAYWHPVAARPREEWQNIVRVCSALRQNPLLADLNATHRFW